MNQGDTVWILENNKNIRECTFIRTNGNLSIIKFENGGGIQVPTKRLFSSLNEVQMEQTRLKPYNPKLNAQLL